MGAYASESITVSDEAIGFTGATINDGRDKPYAAVFVVETAEIRFTIDGSTPTASTGILAEIGDVVDIIGEHDVEKFQAIRTGSIDAVIQPHYFNALG